MNKNIVIGVLVVVIILSNAWQLYGRIDQGVTMSYMDGELYELRNTQAEAAGQSSGSKLYHYIKMEIKHR